MYAIVTLVNASVYVIQIVGRRQTCDSWKCGRKCSRKFNAGKTQLAIKKMNVYNIFRSSLPLDENSREDRPDQAAEHLDQEHPTNVRHRASGLATQIEQRRTKKRDAHPETPERGTADDRFMPVS